jgi:SAM-dependent methyltransferase
VSRCSTLRQKKAKDGTSDSRKQKQELPLKRKAKTARTTGTTSLVVYLPRVKMEMPGTMDEMATNTSKEASMLAASIKQKIKNSLPKPVLEALIYLRHYGPKLRNFNVYVSYVAGKKGIEIGGPSSLFKTVLPVYQEVGDLDGVNFSHETVWEGKIQCGRNFNYIGNRKGFQFILDATDLSQIDANAYDFLLSSNCLEHIANPLKALLEWKKVIRPDGALILVLPNKVHNFDHKRPTTPFEHILEDFNSDTTEYDLTHLDEILALHDLPMDPPAGKYESFKQRSLDNFHNRTLHHHVFDINVIKAMLNHAGYDVVETTETDENFFALATKKH